jgi:two-component system LytT family sensor kinase
LAQICITLMLICLFFLTRTPLFRKLLHKENDNHTALELAAVTAIFSLFAIFGRPYRDSGAKRRG